MSDFTRSYIELLRSQIPNGTIPLHAPEFNGNEGKYVFDTLESTYVSTVGSYVNEFERSIERVTGTKYAVAVSNGTIGLHLLMHCMGIGPGDSVITQSITFVATCNAILHTGASPILLDSGSESLSMSVDALDRYLSDKTYRDSSNVLRSTETDRRIAAILPVHVFGQPASLSKLSEIAELYRIPIIEDGAEALGSQYRGREIGGCTKACVFSFNGNKIITTGAGGVITTNDKALADRLKLLSTTAKESHVFEFIHREMAFNYRMANLNAALGCAQLETLSDKLKKKRSLAEKYKNFVSEHQVSMVDVSIDCNPNNWLNSIKLNSLKERDEFLIKTNEVNIQTRPLWLPMHKTEFLAGVERDSCVNAEDYYNTLVCIPSSAKLDDVL